MQVENPGRKNREKMAERSRKLAAKAFWNVPVSALLVTVSFVGLAFYLAHRIR